MTLMLFTALIVLAFCLIAFAAPVGADRTTMENLLQEQFRDDKITLAINTMDLFNETLMRTPRSVTEGLKYTTYTTTALPDNDRHSKEWDDVSTPYPSEEGLAHWNMTTGGFTIRVSYQLMQDNDGSAVNHFNHQMKLSLEGQKLTKERIWFMESTGKMAGIVSAASATSIVVDNYRLLLNKMHIDVCVGTTGVEGNGIYGAQITAITPNRDNGQGTVTLAAPGLKNFAGVDTTYILVRSGEYNKLPWGLPDIITSTTNPTGGNFGTIDRTSATNDWWRANTWDMAGAPPTPEMIELGMLEIAARFGAMPNQIWMGLYAHKNLTTGRLGDIRRTADQKQVEIWLGELVHQGVEIRAHRFITDSDIWFINTKVIHEDYKASLGEGGEWVKNDAGGRLHNMLSSGKLGVQAAYVRMCQHSCDDPRALGRMTNVAWSRLGTP